MLVRDVIENKGRRVVAIDSDATVSEAIAKLVQNNIGSLPVVDHGGHLIGMFSERDVLRSDSRPRRGLWPPARRRPDDRPPGDLPPR